MSLALLESRKRVEFWTKSTMHASRGIVFGGITGKEKERKWVGRKNWYIGNGERLIKMTAFKKTRGLLFGLLKMRHGALSNGSHVYCHKIIFYLHLLLWSITCQQLQKKKINFDIFVIFWHWSFEERTYVLSSSQICSILTALIYYLLFVVVGPIELKYSRNFKMTIYNWCAIK